MIKRILAVGVAVLALAVPVGAAFGASAGVPLAAPAGDPKCC